MRRNSSPGSLPVEVVIGIIKKKTLLSELRQTFIFVHSRRLKTQVDFYKLFYSDSALLLNSPLSNMFLISLYL